MAIIHPAYQLTLIAAFAMVFVCLFAKSAQAQQCSTGLIEDVCKFGTNRLNIFPGTIRYNTCVAVNKNPFNVASMFGAAGLTAFQCAQAAADDGDKCERFYARAQCASACEECAFNICPSFCDDYATKCPTMTDLGCFDFINCAAPGEQCTAWDVSNDLPNPATTTSTRTTTSSSSHTGTGTGTRTTTTSDSSSAAVLTGSAAIFIFALVSIFA